MTSLKHLISQDSFQAKQYFRISLATILMFAMIVFLGCNKDEEEDFSSGFSSEKLTDNYVMFTNESSGVYYSITYEFGDGVTRTTTDIKSPVYHFYNEAGDYQVTLKTLNFTGNVKSAGEAINVATTDLVLTYTAEVDEYKANYVNLVNTTEGNYDSFKWKYLEEEVEDEMEHIAYFPNEGTYDIEFIITKYDAELSLVKKVTITQDDPANLPDLVWSEEFDYYGLPDAEKWNMEVGGNGWGNNELQYYTDSENNALVDDGILTITAREESFGGRDYTSARITTEDIDEFKYGRFEARIKLPYGQGLWPAFWMLGTNNNSVGWPACGEIDIMEMVGGSNGGDNTVYSTLHWDEGGHAEYGESNTLSYGIYADDYHIFSTEWTPESIISYVDGNKYYEIDISGDGLSAFHNDFFIILNLAVGGNWPGPPDETTTFPQTMEIDYIRVFNEEE